jgi:hypothetical protein
VLRSSSALVVPAGVGAGQAPAPLVGGGEGGDPRPVAQRQERVRLVPSKGGLVVPVVAAVEPEAPALGVVVQRRLVVPLLGVAAVLVVGVRGGGGGRPVVVVVVVVVLRCRRRQWNLHQLPAVHGDGSLEGGGNEPAHIRDISLVRDRLEAVRDQDQPVVQNLLQVRELLLLLLLLFLLLLSAAAPSAASGSRRSRSNARWV